MRTVLCAVVALAACSSAQDTGEPADFVADNPLARGGGDMAGEDGLTGSGTDAGGDTGADPGSNDGGRRWG